MWFYLIIVLFHSPEDLTDRGSYFFGYCDKTHLVKPFKYIIIHSPTRPCDNSYVFTILRVYLECVPKTRKELVNKL
jgi:hypothetical protein